MNRPDLITSTQQQDTSTESHKGRCNALKIINPATLEEVVLSGNDDIDNRPSGHSNDSTTQETLQPDSSYILKTPKSPCYKPTDVRRWASVVKAKKKLILTSEKPENVDITPEILDGIFKKFPSNFEAHKGFISCNESMFYCNVCDVELDSVSNISNHLTIQNHEDNVITFLKQKLPEALHYILEFVSFYESSLYCNLCRAKIDLSSNNPFETIVNVMGHNADIQHTTSKTQHETENDEAYTLLNTLASTIPEIMKNIRFIKKEMCPQFKCELCEKNIFYTNKSNVMAQNFLAHLKSANHLKNEKAVEFLIRFGKEIVSVKDSFQFVNGNIYCIHCDKLVESNIASLISHINGNEHVESVQVYIRLSRIIKKFPDKLMQEKNTRNEGKSIASTTNLTEIKNSLDCKKDEKCTPNLGKLLPSLADFDDINCLVLNEKGFVTCLICDCSVPVSEYNIRTHIVGSNHTKKKLKKFKKENEKDLCQSFEKQTLGNSVINEETKLKKMHLKVEEISDCSAELDDCKVNCSSACYCREIVPTNMQNGLFNQLLEETSLITENKGFLSTVCDGTHVDCALCCDLIPFSDLDQHLQGDVHIYNRNNGNVKTIDDTLSSTINAAISLNGSQILIEKDSTLMNKPKNENCNFTSSVAFNKNSNMIQGNPEDSVLYAKEIEAQYQNYIENLKRPIFSTSTQIGLYDQLLGKSSLVAENRNYLVFNVDGIHMYCILCEALMPFSMDLDQFEINVVQHLLDKVHVLNISNQNYCVETMEENTSNKKTIEEDHFSTYKIKEEKCNFSFPATSERNSNIKELCLCSMENVEGCQRCNADIKRQILPTSTQIGLYEKLLGKNSLVDQNKNFLVLNLDGVHMYCTLCKALVAFSIDLDQFERNVVRHLQGNVHMSNYSKQNNSCFEVSEECPSNSENFLEKLHKSLTALEEEKIKDIFTTCKTKDEKCNLLSFLAASKRSSSIAKECPHNNSTKNSSLCLKKNVLYCQSYGGTNLKRKAFSTRMQNELYKMLLRKNLLVAENKNFLVKNADGFHMYCTLCKSLMPFSLDLDEFERFTVRHLKGKVHVRNYLDHHSASLKTVNQNSEQSLNKNQNTKKENKKLEEKHFSTSETVEEKPNLTSEDYTINSKKIKNVDDVLNCGKVENVVACESNARKALPIKETNCLLTYREELNDEVLNRREKQISYGKNTLGYHHYCSLVPKSKRCRSDPQTPPKHLKCSRRTWDGMVRAWRKQLHAWDPPSEDSQPLHMDIQPLSLD